MTRTAGVALDFGPALGVATADFDNDGWIDIFVANDQQENQLWMNQHDGTFINLALVSGAALGAAGEAKADMGVDAGDFDNDGDEDLFITELVSQGSTLYVNDGTGLFEEQSVRSRIRPASLPYTGFGAAWFDFDNDGWLDILAVNGHVTQTIEALAPDNPFPLQQRNLLLRNLGDQRFEDVTDLGGAVFQLSEVSRGAAFGDIDNDGDVDVLVGNDAGHVRLLINNIGNRSHWLGLRLVGESASRKSRDETWWVLACRSSRRMGRRSGGVREPMGATRRRKTHGSSWVSVSRRSHHASECSGPAGGQKNGPMCQSTNTRR